MYIKSAEFVKGVIGSEGLPAPERPTVAFFGRSNVGKSSVLNAILKKKIAKSSSTPGRTTEVNYFLANETAYFADLPGYGYAKLPIAKREKIRKLLLWYIDSKDVRMDLAVVVFDASVGMKEADIEMVSILERSGRTILLLGNKVDKGKRNETRKLLNEATNMFPSVPLVPFSAKTGEGKEELLTVLESVLF